MVRKIGVLTSGGDSPGMNAAIRAVCAVDGLSVDAGGGVRSMAAVERLAGLGVRRIAIGTALVRDRNHLVHVMRTVRQTDVVLKVRRVLEEVRRSEKKDGSA